MELQQPDDQIDAEKWWTSKEILDEVAVGGDGDGAVQLVADDLDVHVQGDVAWVEGRGRFINRSGAERQIRMFRGSATVHIHAAHPAINRANTEARHVMLGAHVAAVRRSARGRYRGFDS